MELSSSLTSTYRLFLRAISASVLHHGPTKRSFHLIYRRPFVEAALVEKRLLATEDERTRESLEKWLIEWHKRSLSRFVFLKDAVVFSIIPRS